MKYYIYNKDNNIIHNVEIDSLTEIMSMIPNSDKLLHSINEYNYVFDTSFNHNYQNLKNEDESINLRFQKDYTTHGNKPETRKLISQNVNCFKSNDNIKPINIYYDLTIKYNEKQGIILNRFVIIYSLIEKLNRLGYKVNFIPTLFLKAHDNIEINNEYIYVKFNNLDIKTIRNLNMIMNNDVSRILLPEIVKLLDIVNRTALDYNGYLLTRKEKENLIEIKNNDLLIDTFTSEDIFDGQIGHDAKIFYKKINIEKI